MRIRTNVSSLITQRYLQENTSRMNTSMERLSSGYRINRSADDAAGLAVSESIRGKVRGLNQAKRNANDAISMVQVAEGSMNEVSNIMIRLRELATQSASDTIGIMERGYLNREYTQLVDEMDRILQTTEFNGRRFFSEDEGSEFIIQVGTNGTLPEENLDTIRINLEGLKFSTEKMGFGKASEIGPAGEGEESPAREEIASRLNIIDTALTRIASERATLGSIQSRLGSAVNNIGISVENLEAAKSRIRDVDFAAEAAEFTQYKILSQSSTAILQHANVVPEMVLSLLR